ncbi:GntR family transcriptional regulator [Streptacidiphilus sp. 4-A2]|nr:GntR family transcriptional regulator [Streptacidiphilus sp. 4-A2]
MALKRTSLPRTAEAVALAELRDAIVRGDLAPGAQIRQSAAAQELGISIIPLREALKTLAGEGIVTYVPNGATRSPSWTRATSTTSSSSVSCWSTWRKRTPPRGFSRWTSRRCARPWSGSAPRRTRRT